MLFYDYSVQSQDTDHLLTELRYATALAKAKGYELLRLSFTEERRQGSALLKEMKQMKRQGVIRFFLPASAIGGTSAEANYFSNKYPEVQRTVLQGSHPYYYMIGL